MDIMELGAIGELLGGLALLVTLIYLAVQVRNTRKTPSSGERPCSSAGSSYAGRRTIVGARRRARPAGLPVERRANECICRLHQDTGRRPMVE